ncbi:MAG: nucleotidyltransferase, partial [Bacteroidia bacterium]|nr:nucleotidyltransferase [Bacteroidia bacterium]
DKLPEGFELNPERVKPWGTGHAMLMAADVIDAPFAVINADDYYGQESFKVLGEYLKQVDNNSSNYCMVGFYMDKTLSESGGVSRGVCTVDSENFLTTVEEHHHIENKDGKITGEGMDGQTKELDGNAYVSMNMWGFCPNVFKSSKELFVEFLNNNKENITKEFYIPYIVNNGIEKKQSSVKVLSTPDKWFGVTYKEDRPIVVNKLKELSEAGVYPSPLFK